MHLLAGTIPSGEITLLIDQWQAGDRAAEDALFAALYRALHSIALRLVRSEKQADSIGATVLVHEAYLRFNRSSQISIANRAHFLALSARVMRRILVDRARARAASKRDGIELGLAFADLVRSDDEAELILTVDLALTALAEDAPDLRQLVELRFFGGYSEQECAEVIGSSTRTIRRRWQVARVRMKGLIDGNTGGA